MAIESVLITAGSTDAIAVDTVAGTSYQVNKISIAADGSGGSLWDGKTQGGTIDVVSAITTGTIANSGTTTGVGVVGNINGGSIVVTAGTIGATSLTAGTLQTLGTVGTVQNINGGSIVVTAGTIAAHGITAGTLQTVGTVGTVQNINGGSIVVTAGTIAAHGITAGTLQTVGTVGTIQNINGGSIVVTNGTIAAVTTGTIANSGTTTGVGTVAGVGVIGNVNGGSIVVTAGTIASSGTVTGVGVVGNVNGGSIVVTNGTIATVTNLAGGTVKLNYKPSRNIVGFNQTGTDAIGTLVAAPGVGTSTYLTALTVSVMSGTLDVCVGYGTAQSGTSVVERGLFIAGGGLVHDYPVAYSGSITNAALVWTIISGAGTVAISGKYWSEAQ